MTVTSPQSFERKFQYGSWEGGQNSAGVRPIGHYRWVWGANKLRYG